MENNLKILVPELLREDVIEDVIHAKPGIGLSEVQFSGGRTIELFINNSPKDLFMGSESDSAITNKLTEQMLEQLVNTSDTTCMPFPFCDENGCSQWQLMTLIAFQLLLLLLIVISNVTIISVIFDMNKSTRNRRKGMNLKESYSNPNSIMKTRLKFTEGQKFDKKYTKTAKK